MKYRIRTVAMLLLSFFAAANAAWATSYEYDALNRLKRVTYDNGVVIEYSYDAAGNRTQRRIQ